MRRAAAVFRMSPEGLWTLAAMVAAGTIVRVVVAFATYGVQYDIDSAQIVANALDAPGAGPYETGRWPYPPAFFAPIWLADHAARATGLPFHGLVQLPAIAADAALAVLVAWFLRVRGRTERAALAGAALVALGPSFAIISGYHGQIDAAAILPAAVGAVVWVRGGRHRGVVAGLLIGLGTATKTVPLFTALALLPDSRDRREGITLIVAAVAVPLAVTAPWLVADPHGTAAALRANHGVPGFGGLSAFLQPSLTRWWSALEGPPPPVAGSIDAVTSAQNVIVGAAAVVAAAVAAARRRPPLDALVLIWLTVLVVNPNFAYQYVVWALPFLLLAGRLRATALLQAALLTPAVLLYTHADGGGWVYWVTIQAAWLTIVAVWARELWAVLRASPAPRRAGPATSRS